MLKYDTIILLNVLDNSSRTYIFFLNIRVWTSQPPLIPGSGKNLNIIRINSLAECFHLPTSSSRDYLSLNSSCNRELTTTQDTYFQEILNIRKLFPVWKTRNLILLQFSWCSLQSPLALLISDKILIMINNDSIDSTALYKRNKCSVCILKGTKQWGVRKGALWKMTMWLKWIILSIKGLLHKINVQNS